MQHKHALFRTLQGFSFAAALAFAGAASAQEFKSGNLVIDHPHTMPTAPGQPHGGVFFDSIANTSGTPDQLIGGRAAVSKTVEVHRMEMENNVMKMREIPAIDVPAKGKVMMSRGSKHGYHLMLMNLKAPLKEGEKFPMTLIFKNAGEVQVTVAVEKPAMPMHGRQKH